MAYGETKVYFDGSHYIAIPHTERLTKKRPKPCKELITVIEETEDIQEENGPSIEQVDEPLNSFESIKNDIDEQVAEHKENIENKAVNRPKTERKMTRKELFDELYKQTFSQPKNKRRAIMIKRLLPYFKSEDACTLFVDENIERKKRNLISRRIRMSRKANLQDFNYFCTFTYDGSIHTEETFRKGLTRTLAKFSSKKNWKYIGVWERSPGKERLHFHGVFNIPEGTLPGETLPFNDYNTKTHRRQITWQNSYFNSRFGRSDFETIEENGRIGDELAYMMKYIEKTGEKIVYSKGLPQFFISDILDDDIVCKIGQEEQKLLLFDDFMCLDEGCFMGNVSPDVIKQMRKVN